MSSSPAWIHFTKDGDKARCKICSQEVQCKQSTSGLLRHLRAKHGFGRSEVDDVEPPKKRKKSKESALTLMTDIIVDYALDGISLRTIAENTHIKKYLTMHGFKPPTCTRDVIKHVYSKMENMMMTLKTDIADQTSKGYKFSLALDEGSTIRNRKYLNIILYFPDGVVKNLGVVRVEGSCPAERLVKLVREKLSTFSITLEKDIAFVVSDGAPIMVKFARLIGCELQICYNHSIHLAVTDVFYKKKGNKSDENVEIDEFNLNAEAEEDEDEIGDSDEDEMNEDEDIIFQENPSDVIAYSENSPISEILKKCRKIVKIFKRSSVKNAILQKFVTEEHGKELSLLLDCPTRWNSLVPMLKRILQVHTAIEKSLSVLKVDGLSSDELEKCKDIITILEPLEILVLNLSKRSTSLLASEAAIQYTFEHLQNLDSQLSTAMLSALQTRLGKNRRNNNILSMTKYFHDPENYGKENLDFFMPIPKDQLEKKVCKLLKKFEKAGAQEENEEEDLGEASGTSLQDVASCSFAESLKLKMVSFCKKKVAPKKAHNSNLQSVRKELKYFELCGSLPQKLIGLKLALDSVSPTSIEPERTFSLCNFFITKRRSRFSDDAINALIFLKANLKKSQ